MRPRQYSRQESNNQPIPAENPHIQRAGAAESGAVFDTPPSPALSLLFKLTAGLTPDERAALARMLGGSEGEGMGG
jgi:hypothetical protein